MIKITSRSDAIPLPSLRLEGTKAMLRAPTHDDWNEWSALRSESRAFLAPWEPLWPADVLSESVYQRRIRRIAMEWRDDEAYNFHVYDRITGRLVGGIGLSQIKRGIAQSGVIGYWVGQRYARQGYTIEATRLVIDFAFQKLGLHRVEATCIPDNDASRFLLEKLGFKREGYARKYLKIAGEWSDHLLYAVIQDEWEK
jgi:ribosomal-protein-alanine N-acetyltransferase